MRILALALCLFAYSAAAHEFWIEPLDYTPDPDANLQADLVNGEEFEGTLFSFLPQRFQGFKLFHAGASVDVENRLGARPPLDMPRMGDGLHIVAYISNAAGLTYTEWAKFQRFADHKDFGDVLSQHRANGFPEDEFTESYTRYAKSLIGVGTGAGNDTRVGMQVELVMLDNPYTANPETGLRVQSFFGYAPRPDTQIELFQKAPDGTVTITLHRTDAEGIATLPVLAGHSYLVDAVVLRPASEGLREATGAVWETLWASLTFAVPGAN